MTTPSQPTTSLTACDYRLTINRLGHPTTTTVNKLGTIPYQRWQTERPPKSSASADYSPSSSVKQAADISVHHMRTDFCPTAIPR